jgi:hypothetical protein
MTSYIARTGGEKKKNILQQKELALRGDIRREASQDKLQKSAEKVRSAQLGVIKVLIHEAEPARSEDADKIGDTISRLQEANGYWTNLSTQEIIKMYSIEDDEEVVIDRKRWWDFRRQGNHHQPLSLHD